MPTPIILPTMPISLPNLFRVVIMLVLGAHVFYMYSMARTISETVGISPATIAVASLFALIMLISLVWAVALPEFPEMYLRHVRARRWFEQGRCPECGYPTTATRTVRCSECGRELVPPVTYAVSWRTVRLFILINVLAWSIGCTAAESWALVDEQRFRAEAVAYVDTENQETYHRARWWPNHTGRLIYSEQTGVTAAE